MLVGHHVGRDVVAGKEDRHLALEAALQGTAVLLGAGRNHAQGHRRVGELNNALVEGAVQDRGHALLDVGQLALQDVLDVRQRLAGGQVDVDRGVGVHLGLVEHVRDTRVAKHQHVAVAVVDFGRAHADLHHGARVATHRNDVAHAKLALEDDKQPAEKVGDQVLCAKAHGQGDDAGASQQRGGVHAQGTQAPVEHAQQHAVLDCTGKQTADGLAAGAQDVREQAQQPAQDSRDRHGHAGVHDGRRDRKDVKTAHPATGQDIGKDRVAAKGLVLQDDGEKHEKDAQAGKPAQDRSQLLLGGLLAPGEGAVEPARDGRLALLHTAVGQGDIDDAALGVAWARGGRAGRRRHARRRAAGVQRKDQEDRQQAHGRHSRRGGRQGHALGHELALGAGDKQVVVVRLDAVRKQGLAAHGNVIRETILKLGLSKTRVLVALALDLVGRIVGNGAAGLVDGKGKARRAHLDTVEHVVDLHRLKQVLKALGAHRDLHDAAGITALVVGGHANELLGLARRVVGGHSLYQLFFAAQKLTELVGAIGRVAREAVAAKRGGRGDHVAVAIKHIDRRDL